MIATGRESRDDAVGFQGLAGVHAECLPWLREREIAALGSDGITDPIPGLGIPNWPFPIHMTGIAGMGIHLVDNMALARAGRRVRRAQPLGVPVHAVAVARRGRHRLPGQPPRRAVSDVDALRALDQRYSRAIDARDMDELTALFDPAGSVNGARGSSSVPDYLEMTRTSPACSSRACTCSATR